MALHLSDLYLPGENRRPFLIAGPCAAESERQVLETAQRLSAIGCKIFRAGVWKPRTKPGGFEGHGEIALRWMEKARENTGMLLATEVATPLHVEDALKHNIDILWIGARTTANPFAVQAIADSLEGIDIPVFVKNPVNPELELWIGALERLNRAGITRLGAIHRGFSSFENKIFRNDPKWSIPIELHRRIPGLTILTDPSHIGGDKNLVASLSQQAMDLGFNGLMIECHYEPENALSDAAQQLTPEALKNLMTDLIIRNHNVIKEGISGYRKQIDEIDDRLMELLALRMKVCKEIGMYKKEKNLTVLQSGRYDEILKKRCSQGKANGMSPDFIAKIFGDIHEESVRQQIDIINN